MLPCTVAATNAGKLSTPAVFINSISIAANRGNDTFRFENLPAIPVTIDGTVFDDGFNIDFVSGVSSLTINGYDGNDTITLGTGVSDFLTINSLVNVFGGNGGDTHTLGEWFDDVDGLRGVARAMSIIRAASGG